MLALGTVSYQDSRTKKTILPVIETTYRTIDFSKHTTTILYAARVTYSCIVLIARCNPETMLYDNVTTMGNFIGNNAWNEDWILKNFETMLADFRIKGGGELDSTTSVIIIGGNAPEYSKSIMCALESVLKSHKVYGQLNLFAYKESIFKNESESVNVFAQPAHTQIVKLTTITSSLSKAQFLTVEAPLKLGELRVIMEEMGLSKDHEELALKILLPVKEHHAGGMGMWETVEASRAASKHSTTRDH